MSGLTIIILGGIIGAVLNVFWQDPYRNRMGQYKTRTSGFQSWIIQAALGAIAGSALTTAVGAFLVSSPLIVGLVLLVGCWFVYKREVDPR